jgi:hypothetical protein
MLPFSVISFETNLLLDGEGVKAPIPPTPEKQAPVQPLLLQPARSER